MTPDVISCGRGEPGDCARPERDCRPARAEDRRTRFAFAPIGPARQVIADCPTRVADLSDADLLALPGVGKDLAAQDPRDRDDRNRRLPPGAAARVPADHPRSAAPAGRGPKTVALLYTELRIASLDELEQAAASGALRKLKGMGAKKEELILKAIAERRQHAGRHLAGRRDAARRRPRRVAARGRARRRPSTSSAASDAARDQRRHRHPGQRRAPVADGCTSSRYHLVERVLGRGDTKSSVLLWKGFQADLRLVEPAVARRGAAVFHRLEGAQHRGAPARADARLHPERVRAVPRRHRRARSPAKPRPGSTRRSGLPCIDPALRENRGELAAADAGTLPALLTFADLRGDVHMHTTESDGKDDLETMARAAQANGLSYIAITDHSQALAMANGLDDARALAHAARIRALEHAARRHHAPRRHRVRHPRRRHDGSRRRHAGTARHRHRVGALGFQQSAEEMTARVLRAIENPWVDVIGHPTGRKLLKPRAARARRRGAHRPPRPRTASRSRSTANYHRLDLSDIHARHAKDRGVKLLDLERRAFDHRARPAALGRPRGAARVAVAGRCPEHAVGRRVQGVAATSSPPGESGPTKTANVDEGNT